MTNWLSDAMQEVLHANPPVLNLYSRGGMTCIDSIILKPGLGLSLLIFHSTGQGWKIMIIQSLLWS